ncbi:aldehyde dehydrogenase family protein [Streptomyces bobili]|uniref:aldehyde dehydrogenase family protein n=1 Tax=Streptomyces bobili TaxID=67280 RepID=UPI00382670B3
MKTDQWLIPLGGDWVQTGSSMPVRDPEDGRVIAHVAQAGPEQVSTAVAAAVLAATAARRQSALTRSDALRSAADRVAAEQESFARTIAEEGVKTIREARREVARCVQTLRLSGEEAQRLGGETIRFDGFAGGEHRIGYWTRDPVGVVAAITPFNDPLNLVAHKIGPAIAAGNAVILKPHEATPLSALRLAALLIDSDLPPGMLQVLPGRGDVVGAALVAHPAVRMVSFTGGRAVGEHIARTAGPKKLAMELGNNGATIVLDDADLDRAVPAIVQGAYAAAGQNCLHVQRVLIHRAVYSELADRLAAAASELRLGAKLSEDTDMGPLINEAAAHRVTGLIKDAVTQGARVLSGGSQRGTSIEPTLIDQVPDGHALAREEIFGPVTVLQPIDSLAEAIAIANTGGSDLQAAVFTRSLDAAFHAIDALETGGVVVNDSTDYRTDSMPFGAANGAGIGREGIRYSCEAMSEPKVVCLTLPERTTDRG